jgi:lipopolysaccharide biosynthesis glycosyltransferase
MRDPIGIALCFDRHLALPAAITIASVLRNRRSRVQFHLVVDPSPDLARLLHTVLKHFGGDGRIIEAAPEAAFDVDARGPYGVPSTATYRRLLLPELLPELDRLIYLDADIIVRDDLAELWTTALNDYPLGAVPDAWAAENETMRQRFPGGYFNCGVLLMDLVCWRAQSIERRAFALVHECLAGGARGPLLYDQDPLNDVLKGSWQRLSPRWNFTAYFTDAAAAALSISTKEIDKVRDAPAIVHFVGGYKPWLDEYSRISRYHAEFAELRAELEHDIDFSGFAWPGRFKAQIGDRARRLLAMSLVQRALAMGRPRWVVVAKGTLVQEVLTVAREQNLDIACIASENPLFSDSRVCDLDFLWVPEAIHRGYDSFLIADYRSSANTRIYVEHTAAAAGAKLCIIG